jgi:hypothetical protein
VVGSNNSRFTTILEILDGERKFSSLGIPETGMGASGMPSGGG